MNMSFQREYAESYDWLTTQFRDWAFTFVSIFPARQADNRLGFLVSTTWRTDDVHFYADRR